MSQIPMIPLPVTGNVEADIPCRKCGYNLRGLPFDGRCPECATPVGVSVNGELLRYSEPGFVDTLHRGVQFILWGILAIILLAVASAILAAMHMLEASHPMIHLVGFVVGLPCVIGAWLLTTPDPSGLGEDRYGTARKIIRISIALGILDNLVSFIAGMVGPLSPTELMLFSLVKLIFTLIGLAGTVAQLAYLKNLALRIPDYQLSERANTLMWGLGVSYGLMIVIGFISGQIIAANGGLKAGSGSSPLVAVGCFAGIIGIVVIVFAFMYLFMLGRFGRHFKEQAAIARMHWAQAAPGVGPIAQEKGNPPT
jgi:hypothetical protein